METIPIPLTDLISPVPNIRTRTFFILNDRLDVDVLRKALDELIRDHWRKLGSRVVWKGKGEQPEYRLPKTFDDDYVLFNWSSKDSQDSIDNVTQSLKRPSADGIAFLPSISDVDSCFRPADWPFEQKDDPADAPILYVHVCTFSDATVVTVSMAHVFGDQLGLANIVKAWMGLIEGKTPPPFVGYTEEVLPHDKKFADMSKRETHRKGKMRVRRFGEYFFVLLGFIPELVFQAKEDDHNIFFPIVVIESLRKRASKELEQKYGDDAGLSHADILSGILTKFSRMSKASPTKLSLSQAVNLRGRIPELSGLERDGYIHNGMVYATARYRHEPSTPVSEIAYLNRQAVKEAIRPEEVDIGLAVMREMVTRGQSLHNCEPFEKSYSVTNWCGAWKGVDFANAVRKSEKQGNEVQKLDMLILGQGGELKTPKRFHSTVMCKTDDGYWIDFSTSVKGMKAIKEYIASDPLLERF
ncbi:hypothetical protein QQZ08_007926 [Neonectria magnoliae]|uniref:Uncharacterized protein n=1 Tax=Neonectria magnoliae TaxID=2732573 RepID=A0ABR1HWG2_9HYPO